MIISISGKAGSGKSTIAKMLADKLGYKYYSMGELQRKIAKKLNISITELGELEKTNPEIDKMIDNLQKQLGEKEDNFVIDSWLGGFFIPKAFKIFMYASLKERAKRILEREPGEYENLEDAITKIKQREKTNRERWLKYYGFDYEDMTNYDLVVDTTNKNTEEVFNLVYERVKEELNKRKD